MQGTKTFVSKVVHNDGDGENDDGEESVSNSTSTLAGREYYIDEECRLADW